MTAAMLRLEAGRDPLKDDLTALVGELSTLRNPRTAPRPPRKAPNPPPWTAVP